MNPLKEIVDSWKELIAISPQREKEIEKEVDAWFTVNVWSKRCRCNCGCSLKSIRSQCANCRIGVHKGK